MYLHFGQKRGKSSNTVCGRICVLVLPPHLGQRSQSIFDFSCSTIFITYSFVGEEISVICRVLLFTVGSTFIYLSAISLISERKLINSSSVNSNVQFVSSSISFLGSTLPLAKYLANDAQILSSDICTAFPLSSSVAKASLFS